MKDKVIVHGAAGSIGSSCVEIAAGRDHLILDYGKPLEGEGPVPFVIPRKRFQRYQFFLSHSHLDHWGNVNEIPTAKWPINEKIHVLATERTIKAMKLQDPETDFREIEKMYPDSYWGWHKFWYAYVYADHSAPDACSFIISTKHNTILYTGDFRLHGRLSGDYIRRIKAALTHQVFEGKPLTVITEATNAGKEAGPSEKEVEDALVKEFSQHGLVMVKMANQNLQRLVSVYNACKRSGRILVTEPYTALCAAELGKQETGMDGHPAGTAMDIQPDGVHWKVFNIQSGRTNRMAEDKTLYRYGGKLKITKEELVENADNLVVIANYHAEDYLEKKGLIDRVVWSMWTGYPEYEQLCAKHNVRYIHSSGHVYEKDLIAFIRELTPKKTIVMHSTDSIRVANLLSDLTEPVVLSDGQAVRL